MISIETLGGFYITQIKQLQDRIFERFLSEQGLKISGGQEIKEVTLESGVPFVYVISEEEYSVAFYDAEGAELSTISQTI